MKKLLIAVLLPAAALASECVLQNRTVTATTVTIQERSGIKHTVVPVAAGSRCLVTFQARIGTTWHLATGQYDWSGDTPSGEACAVAMSRAEDSVKTQSTPSHVRSEKVLVCNDNPELATLRLTNPGTIGKLHQFRPYPDFPKQFWHNGAKCRWFLETGYRRQEIHTYQGIICQLQDSNWVVVDKF
jgi:hypothetical protein